MSKRDTNTLLSIILGGVTILASALYSLAKSMGQYGILFIILGSITLTVLGLWFNERQRKIRRQQLMDKYGDTEIVELIMSRKVWIGATSDHVIDSWGTPVAVDRKVLKTKVKEVWKYNRQGHNRFANRVILDDGIVVGHESGNVRG